MLKSKEEKGITLVVIIITIVAILVVLGIARTIIAINLRDKGMVDRAELVRKEHELYEQNDLDKAKQNHEQKMQNDLEALDKATEYMNEYMKTHNQIK